MKFSSKLPPIYHPLFPELLDLEYPKEAVSTCDNCTLCRSKQSPYVNVKCCSYHPHLANYLIGGILCDNDVFLLGGKNRILGQIKNRIGVTPYGIIPGEKYFERNIELKSQKFWEKPKELLEVQLCPYYDKGSCTVWKYRENLCVTYFCSSIGGNSGKSFWKKINQYLKMAETDLAQYAMLQLGWPPEKIKTHAVTTSDFKLEDEDGKIIEENYAKLWGDWAGREAEFYQKCYEIVSNVNADTFKRITGVKREILEAAIWETNREFLENVLPERMILNPQVEVKNWEEGHLKLSLGEVSAKIPALILPLIRAFNGKRETPEVFHLGYNVIYNMSEVVDELREKGILVKA